MPTPPAPLLATVLLAFPVASTSPAPAGSGLELRDGAPSERAQPPTFVAQVDADGLRVRDPEGAWALTLRTSALGRGTRLAALAGAVPLAGAERVELAREGLLEWFRADGGRIAHGWRVDAPPSGSPDEPLVLGLEWSGLETLELERGRRGVTLVPRGARLELRYAGLRAFDARGRELEAWMRAAGERLELRVDDRDALYPLEIDPVLAAPSTFVSANDARDDEWLGTHLSLDGERLAAAGFSFATGSFGLPPRVLVFERQAGAWELAARLSSEQYGPAVALQGERLVVAGERELGGAFVLEHGPQGWLESAHVETANARSASVALDGDTFALGTPLAGQANGQARVYVASGGTWSLQAILAPPVGLGAGFGRSLALEGDVLVVLANGGSAGAAAVYRRSGASWTLEALLAPSDAGSGASTEGAVALRGEVVLVGAPLHDGPAVDAGAAYVFRESAGQWSEEQKLVAQAPGAHDRFGSALALGPDRAWVGAPYAANGTVESFHYDGAAWNAEPALPSAGPRFGAALAAQGERLAVGSPLDDASPRADAGALHVFEHQGGSWDPSAILSADESGDGDALGSSVALAPPLVLVGVPYADARGASACGSAYVQRLLPTVEGTVCEARLLASDLAPGDRFGSAVALDGVRAAVGAPGDDLAAGADAGSCTLLLRGPSGWNEEVRVDASNAAAGDAFGSALALQGDTLLVGAPQADTAAGTNAGLAYVFERDGAGWSEVAVLAPSGAQARERFGSAVALDGDTALVGAPLADVAGVVDAGRAAVFVRVAGAWTEQALLVAPLAATGDDFGAALALQGDTALVGVPQADAEGLLDAGAAHVFTRTGTSWAHERELAPAARAALDHFGVAVALSSELGVVGADGADAETHPHSGCFDVYSRAGGAWVGTRVDPTSVPGNTLGVDRWGATLAVAADTLLVGAPGDDHSNRVDPGSARLWRWRASEELCAGDDASCPCHNGGTAGAGCDNAQATGGVHLELVGKTLGGSGFGTLTFRASGFPPAAAPTAIAFRGDAELVPPVPFGDGLLCVQGPVTRFGATSAAGGVSEHAYASTPADSTRVFQVWYRSTPKAFCDPAAASNTSNAVRVRWP